MIRINVHEAKTHLSAYLARLEAGEKIVLCRRNKPIAEICPLPPGARKPRQLGVGGRTATLCPSFFEPLPKHLLDLFEGRRE